MIHLNPDFINTAPMHLNPMYPCKERRKKKKERDPAHKCLRIPRSRSSVVSLQTEGVLLFQLMLLLIAMLPRASAFTALHIHKRTLAYFPAKLKHISRPNYQTKEQIATSTATATAIPSPLQMKKEMSNSNSNSESINDIDFENFGFSFESFDKEGQWMSIDWKTRPQPALSSDIQYDISLSESDARIATYSPDEPSPVQLSIVRDRMVYIKRDDLLHLHKSNVSGNKARKLLALNELSTAEFPDVVVSYGGPQSNAMVAIAAIVNARNVELAGGRIEEDLMDEIESGGWLKLDDDDDDDADDDDDDDEDDNKNDEVDYAGEDSMMKDDDHGDDALHQSQQGMKRKKRFVYYAKKLPRYLRKQPNGNLLRALSLGMEIVEISNGRYKDIFGGEEGGSAIAPLDIEPPVPMKSLWVPQGGACGIAGYGAKLMAQEIVSFWETKGNGMPLTVCVPGGTGTTAMLLSREINSIVKQINDAPGKDEKMDILVGVIPCVGDAEYAERQMRALDISTGGNGKDDIPQVFKPWKNGYPRFGEPSPHILNTFIEMKDEHGIYLDLLYGAPAWNLLLQYVTSQRESPIKGRKVMYVHSGGLEGISSQLTRYKHKGLINGNETQ